MFICAILLGGIDPFSLNELFLIDNDIKACFPKTENPRLEIPN